MKSTMKLCLLIALGFLACAGIASGTSTRTLLQGAAKPPPPPVASGNIASATANNQQASGTQNYVNKPSCYGYPYPDLYCAGQTIPSGLSCYNAGSGCQCCSRPSTPTTPAPPVPQSTMPPPPVPQSTTPPPPVPQSTTPPPPNLCGNPTLPIRQCTNSYSPLAGCQFLSYDYSANPQRCYCCPPPPPPPSPPPPPPSPSPPPPGSLPVTFYEDCPASSSASGTVSATCGACTTPPIAGSTVSGFSYGGSRPQAVTVYTSTDCSGPGSVGRRITGNPECEGTLTTDSYAYGLYSGFNDNLYSFKATC